MIRKNTAGEKDSVLAVIILFLMGFILSGNRVWLYTALAVSLVSVLSPLTTLYLHRGWTILTEILGRISGGVILTIVYVFILMPTALFKKWFGRKDMILKKENISSTFQTRNHMYSEGDLDNPW